MTAVGDNLPDIKLTRPDGSLWSAQDSRGKPLVLFFYPKDDTPGCTNEAKDFSALAGDFAAAGVAVMGISKDPPAKHVKFIAKHGLTVDLATDPEADGLSDVLGFWKEKSMYGKTYMGMERTTLLADADGRIVRIWPKVKVAGHAQEVLDAARALG